MVPALPLVKQDDAFRALVREVRAVRKESVICPSAADGVNIPELLAEMIQKEAYREDYRNLTEKLLEEEVDYDTAVTALERNPDEAGWVEFRFPERFAPEEVKVIAVELAE